ncbi:MAG: DUF374 domain-containing protein [Bacteriovoracaceae bacterium]|nr:DUF374 domain-containing protein [Bacteriovoracaceae bacterium]
MLKQKILGLLAGFIYKIYSSTFSYQFHYEDESNFKLAMQDLSGVSPSSASFLYAFWHQDELSLLGYFQNSKTVIMSSPSKDGTIMATALEFLGYVVVAGSSDKKPIQGFLASLKKIKKGYRYAMAVDGPKGPIFKSKEGIIKLSEKTQKKIFPVRAFPEKYYCFKRSWNQAKLPLPFTKIHLIIGKANFYSNLELDNALNKLHIS